MFRTNSTTSTDGTDNEDCFSKTVLKNVNGQVWMPVDHAKPVGYQYVDKMQLPANLTCDRCTLSWRWDGALENSIFTNCADIKIVGSIFRCNGT